MAHRTNAGYLKELCDLRSKLSDFLELLQKGKYSYYKEIALKLRVLYFDKSGTKALLKEILARYQLKLIVLISYTTMESVERGDLPESLAKGLVMEQVNSVVSWLDQGQEKMSPFDALERKEILINDESFSYREVIEVVADKMAAHIDRNVPNKHLNLHSQSILLCGLPIAQRAIFDTAMTSIVIIDSLLEHISEGTKFQYIARFA